MSDPTRTVSIPGRKQTDVHEFDTYQRIIDETSEHTRETIATVASLLGAPAHQNVSPRAWSARRLNTSVSELTAVVHRTSRTGIAVLGYVLGSVMDQHGTTDVGGPGDAEPPAWSPLRLGTNDQVMVPARLTVHFPAGTLADVGVCIAIDNEEYELQLTIYTSTSQRATGQTIMSDLLDRCRTSSPYRGHILESSVDGSGLSLSIASAPPAPRSALVLPEHLWNEVDLFVAAATHRRADMQALGLGTNRGLLLTGPPGTGKTHLSRVIATELCGDFTVIIADAATVRRYIHAIYNEAEVLGRLVVILEDIDLVVGHRKDRTSDSLADFLSAMDGVTQQQDVFTIATTNDPAAIDPAAQRTARFDTILTLPRPGAPERQSILRAYLAPLGLDLDLASTAALLDGCTGSDVREVVRRAVLEHGRSFTVAELDDVARSGRWRPQPSTGQYL